MARVVRVESQGARATHVVWPPADRVVAPATQWPSSARHKPGRRQASRGAVSWVAASPCISDNLQEPTVPSGRCLGRSSGRFARWAASHHQRSDELRLGARAEADLLLTSPVRSRKRPLHAGPNGESSLIGRRDGCTVVLADPVNPRLGCSELRAQLAASPGIVV